MEILVDRNAYPVAGLVEHTRVPLAEDTCIRDFLRAYGIPEEDDPYILPFVNGARVALDYVLIDGDSLGLFRLSVGG